MKKINFKQWLLLLMLAIFISACDDDDDDKSNVTDFTAELSVNTHGNESGLISVEYKVTLSATNFTGEAITFDFNTIDGGTATAEEDYTAITGTFANLIVANGSATGAITVDLIQDNEFEETETIIGQISNPGYSGVTIIVDRATANIEDDDLYANGVFITNEGAYGAGNGSISYYSYNTDELTNNIFSTVNERVLGDVVQSVTVHNNRAYIVVNVSNKIEVVAKNNFIEQGTITGITSPRYFIGIDDNKGYVSEWGTGYGTNVKVVDLTTLTIEKTITTGTGPEKMLLYNDYVYVTNSGGYGNDNTVSVINPATDEVIKTITLDGDNPRDLVVDSNGSIWVLCAGYIDYYSDPMTETPSKLIKINPSTNEVTESITIGASYHPTCLETSKNGNNVFYGGGYGVQGIYKMSINDVAVPDTPLIDKEFYGFNINSETGNIFAMEAPSFTANGILWRYEANGTELGSYEAGIGPNSASTKRANE